MTTKVKTIKMVATYSILIIAVFCALFPLYWTFTTAFKLPKDAFCFPPKYFPFKDFRPTLYAWRNIGLVGTATGTHAHEATQLFSSIKNTVIVAVSSTLLALILGCPAAYALARFRYRVVKNKDIAFFILSQRMMPPIVLVLPFFVLFKALRQLDTLQAIIITHTIGSLPFVVWIMHGFFLDLPRELEESAQIDGCSLFGALVRIVLPLSTPGLVATSIFCFIFSWNELLFALSLSFKRARTLPAFISGFTFSGAPLWWNISAMLILSITPIIIFCILIQSYIVRGLTLGAVKE